MANPFINYQFPVTGTGAVNRTMPDRLADYYNVKDFGALGDNSTTTVDRNAIQAATNACVAGGGGTVYFPQGSYLLNGPVTCGSNTQDVGVRFLGSGKSGTTLN